MAPNPPVPERKRRPSCLTTACTDSNPCTDCYGYTGTVYYYGGYYSCTTHSNACYTDNEEKLRKQRESKAHFDDFIRGRGKRKQRR